MRPCWAIVSRRWITAAKPRPIPGDHYHRTFSSAIPAARVTAHLPIHLSDLVGRLSAIALLAKLPPVFQALFLERLQGRLLLVGQDRQQLLVMIPAQCHLADFYPAQAGVMEG